MAQLDCLPPETLFNILSFTEPTRDPTSTSYALNALAATSKHLKDVVEEYARALLKQHANIIPPKTRKTFTCRRKWLGELCQFCRKNSMRKATLYPIVTCCYSCDREHYPKITMTGAANKYCLSKLDLFTPNILHPDLPSLLHGHATVLGGDSTMILESDVIARRDYILQLLRNHSSDAEHLRRNRVVRHGRVIKTLGAIWNPRRGRWSRDPRNLYEFEPNSEQGLRTPTRRSSSYAKLTLQQEKVDLGMNERVDSAIIDEDIHQWCKEVMGE